MNYSWTKQEIDLVVQYENILNEYFCSPYQLKDESIIQEILFLEGMLLMINKYVVVCCGGSAEDVLSFREYLALEQNDISQEKIITFFPINFINESEYVNHLANHQKVLESS